MTERTVGCVGKREGKLRVHLCGVDIDTWIRSVCVHIDTATRPVVVFLTFTRMAVGQELCRVHPLHVSPCPHKRTQAQIY